jgi:NAD(P)-dependent dehydrogenase (short-subunit alcohol dehydrogenase family)
MSTNPASQYTGTGTAIVTGAAQGIGRSIALRLAEDGFNLVINDIPSKEDKINAVRDEILNARNVKCAVVTGDVSKEEDVKNIVEVAEREYGGLDVVCFYQSQLISLLY